VFAACVRARRGADVALLRARPKRAAVDQDEMGQWDLASEGFMAGYGFFLVCWISVYSLTLKAQ
jgi:phage portal protein BeeE